MYAQKEVVYSVLVPRTWCFKWGYVLVYTGTTILASDFEPFLIEKAQRLFVSEPKRELGSVIEHCTDDSLLA